MVALTGGMFLSGHTTPRLGIDLVGGTSITLKAKSQPGKPEAINETNMNTAVSIIERRVNGLGVSEAEVQTQGASNIIVNIPKGTNSAQAREQVGTTAQLYFRPVLTVAAWRTDARGFREPVRHRFREAERHAQCEGERPGDGLGPEGDALGRCHHPGPCRHRRPEEGRDADPLRRRGVGRPRGDRDARRGHRGAPEEVHRARLHRQGGPRGHAATV